MSITRPTSTSYKSSRTGRIYEFRHDSDGSSRRAALAQLEADDRGADAQPKRPPAPAPVRDTRRPADRFADRIAEANRPENKRENKTLDVAGGLNNRLEQLRRDAATALTSVARAKIKRRIAVLENRLADFDTDQAAAAQRAALFATDEYRATLVDVEAVCLAIHTNTSLDESFVTDAQIALAELKGTGDHAAARFRIEALQARFAAQRDERLAGVQSQMDALEQQASLIKSSGGSIDPSAPKPAPPGSPKNLYGDR